MRAAFAALLLFSSLPACLGPDRPGGCVEPAGSLLWLPLTAQGDSQPTDGRQPWDALLFANTTAAMELEGVRRPSGWNLSEDRLGSPTSLLRRLRLEPSSNPQAGDLEFDWRFRSAGDKPCGPSYHSRRVALSNPVAGDVASPGKGALVYTAGFWENGTLFYTNMAEVNESWTPRAGWYTWEGADPLPVYVYDSSRNEKPAQWTACAPSPPGDGSCAWNYFTTIEGFNEALKGLSTNTARVVHIIPERAYTKTGNENHPLYGDALVFYIRVVQVDDVPCPTPSPLPGCWIPSP